MQAIELTLLNLPQTLYAVKDTDNYNKKDLVVVSLNGCLDLAVVKDIIELQQDVEYIRTDNISDCDIRFVFVRSDNAGNQFWQTGADCNDCQPDYTF